MILLSLWSTELCFHEADLVKEERVWPSNQTSKKKRTTLRDGGIQVKDE